jgi:hypothetical protein
MIKFPELAVATVTACRVHLADPVLALAESVANVVQQRQCPPGSGRLCPGQLHSAGFREQQPKVRPDMLLQPIDRWDGVPVLVLQVHQSAFLVLHRYEVV